MRCLRAFAGVVGASGSVIAAGGLLLAILSAGVAFHGWPNMRDPDDRIASGATELAAAPSKGVALRVDDAAAATTLPTVPVRRASVRRAATTRKRAERRPATHRAPVPSATDAPHGTSPSTRTTPSAGAVAPQAEAPRAGEPSSSARGKGPSAIATPTTPSSANAPVATPPTPSVSAPPSVADPAAQTVKETTAAAGDAVSTTTSGAAQAVQPAAPGLASTVTAVGQAVDDTVTEAGQAVGGILTGLAGGKRWSREVLRALAARYNQVLLVPHEDGDLCPATSRSRRRSRGWIEIPSST
jgi:hypothetical protein